MKKNCLYLIACMGILYMLSGCKSTNVEIVSKDGFYFDTMISISVSAKQGGQLLDECFVRCEELEKIFSRTRSDSELYAINHRTESTLEVSDEMAFVIEEGLRYYELSDGMLDITIAPLLELWDFKGEEPAVPEAGALAAAAAKVNGSGIHLEGNTLSFDHPDTEIDLGALVKGYAADCLKDYLVSEGVESGMINLGGNVLAIGKKTDKSLWKVGIQRPFSPRNETLTQVEVDGKSVVSSGVYERFFESAGIRYHHILGPQTGYPVASDLWQATVVSENSMEGDALSTICILKGKEAAVAFLEEFEDVEVILVTDAGEVVSW